MIVESGSLVDLGRSFAGDAPALDARVRRQALLSAEGDFPENSVACPGFIFERVTANRPPCRFVRTSRPSGRIVQRSPHAPGRGLERLTNIPGVERPAGARSRLPERPESARRHGRAEAW